MAGRAQPLTLAGLASAGVILALVLGPLGAVFLRAETTGQLSAADWAAIRFTLVQALLSASFSVALAVPVARALARRQFRGRSLLVALLGAPFILPVIVAVLGLLAVFGRAGVLNTLLGWFGLPPVQIYGLHGVVIAHVFFNMPLATRLILQGWLAIPSERFRLAASLSFRPRDMFALIEWPMLRDVLPGAFMVIFLICTTSFAVALTLGGGPRATTIELAIYQAFRFDFDLARAALLGLVQLLVTGGAAALALWVSVPAAMGAGLDRTTQRWDARRTRVAVADFFWIAFAALFLITPLAMIAGNGIGGLFSLPPPVAQAALRSLGVALGSAALTLTLCVPIAVSVYRFRARPGVARSIEAAGYIAMAVSPLVVGTGLFILLYPFSNPAQIALVVTAVVNAAFSLPFALRVLVPAIRDVEDQFGRLADSLNIVGWRRLRWAMVPRLRRPLGFAAGLAAALSMGDLGVIVLFADAERPTLPLMVYRLMASYQMTDAAAAALLLVILSFSLFWCFDRGGRINADA